MRSILLVGLLLAACSPGSEPPPNPAPGPPPAASPASPPVCPGFLFLREEAFSCGGQAYTVPIYRHQNTDLEFVLVPGGGFTMGSPEGEQGRYSDEGPRHRVRIEPFLLGRTEVPQAAWDKGWPQEIEGSNASFWRKPELPVENVGWGAARQWCQGVGLRLPTEAEWEYACRAGTSSRFCFGDSERDLADFAWFEGNSGERTHPVGRKLPNAFGLHDMHGNVWEWCEDAWYPSYSGAPADGGPRSGDPGFWVRRGGSYIDDPDRCRSTYRARGNRGYSFNGFRAACSIP